MKLSLPRLPVQLVVSLAFALAILGTIAAVAWPIPFRGADSNAYLVAARLLERGADPYTSDPATWKEAEASLGPVAPRYRYPVHTALVLQAIGVRSPTTLWIAIVALNILAALAAAVLIGLSVRGWRSVPLALCLVGASASNVDTLVYGNVTDVVLFALAAGFYALQRSSTRAFVLTVPLGVVLKLLPIVLLPVALARRSYRLALYAFAATLAWFLVPVVFVGAESSLRFFRDLGEIVTPSGFLTNNQSILAVFVRQGWPQEAATAARGIVLGLLAWLFLRCWMRPTCERNSALFAAILCAALLVPVNSFYMYQAWLIFPLCFALDFLWHRRQAWPAIVLLVLYVVCQVLSVLPEILHRVLPAHFPPAQSLTEWLGSYPAFFCVVVFSISVWIGLRREQPQTIHPEWMSAATAGSCSPVRKRTT